MLLSTATQVPLAIYSNAAGLLGGNGAASLSSVGSGVGSLGYAVQEPPLTTDWTYKLGENPWYQYPRPQMVRDRWQNLNGVWSWQNATHGVDEVNHPPFGKDFSQAVLVPSCLESGISGVQADIGSVFTTWYKTQFTVPEDWNDENIILNFDAVDYEATVFVNGHKATFHRGGYIRFDTEITSYINRDSSNELLVFVHDPTDAEGHVIPIGKQTLNPSHIFYRPCSGIWQSVWIEPVPTQNHISALDVSADMHGKVNITVHTYQKSSVAVEAWVHTPDSTTSLGKGKGKANKPFTFAVSDVELWTPDSPHLYNITIKMGDDQVEAYTGFRTLSKGMVNGVMRPLLNGEFIFAFGTLDQGYWPDGLHTAPNLEAAKFDIDTLKDIGFNMLRKHIKVEPDLYYRLCDEIGILVIQDMPCLPPNGPHPNQEQQEEWERQLFEMIQTHRSFPSIYTWVIYNEGWGQLASGPEKYLTPIVHSLDPTRLINSVSGWNHHGSGDYLDNHHYSSPQCGTPFYSIASGPYDPEKIGFQGEFGGNGHNVSIEQAHNILRELRDQIERYACSGGVWTQTTDVEGEVNGLLTYDRRLLRTDLKQWKEDIADLYSAAKARITNGPAGHGNEVCITVTYDANGTIIERSP